MNCTHFNHRELDKHGWVITVQLYGSTIGQWKVGEADQYDIETDDGEVTSITVNGETKMTEDDLTGNMDVSVSVDAHQLCTKCGWREEL
jgi:hypothetical protein